MTKQFLQHTDPLVLSAAIQAINHLTTNDSMSASNSTKSLELEESVFSSLRQAIGGEEVFSMSIGEALIPSIQAIFMRMGLLQRSRDIVDTMESEDGGQSSGWEIVLAFVERGEVGYREESRVSWTAISPLCLSLLIQHPACSPAQAWRTADIFPDRRTGNPEHLPAYDMAVQKVYG